MKYLCLIYGDESAWANRTQEQAASMFAEYMAYTDDIRKSGHMIAAEALQPTSSATTIRVRDGKVSTTDGPYAETKVQLGGFYLVEAKDLNDAIQVASRIPGAKHGAIEVRPVRSTGG